MANILIKERLKIRQVAKAIYEAFGDRYTASAKAVEMKIRRLRKPRCRYLIAPARHGPRGAT